ncbi:hypothetical protein F4779DRAFT_620875 [Xylariaceae sp. FL0662B]|nr:hypothetical protein F4779DRAFT_620875 [Xylariaceae sp. FL0662B]
MATSAALPTAVLAIYATLSLPAIYVAIKHGFKHGAILGWGFLLAFCVIRITSSALEIRDEASSTAALLSGIGLSPLLSSACGVLHESRAYLFRKVNKYLEIPWLVLFHLQVMTAIALVASGASRLNNTLSPDQVTRSLALVRAGMVILLLAWFLLTGFAVTTLGALGYKRKAVNYNEGKKLLLAVIIATPFLGIRVLERLVYYFTQNPLLNPVTGSISLRAGLEVVEEMIVTLFLVVAGIITRSSGFIPRILSKVENL